MKTRNEKIKIKKSKNFGLTIERDAAFYGPPDSRASISFGRPRVMSGEFNMLVSFRYDGDVKTFSRSMFLNLKETIALVKYLNNCVYDEFRLMNLESMKKERIMEGQRLMKMRGH